MVDLAPLLFARAGRVAVAISVAGAIFRRSLAVLPLGR